MPQANQPTSVLHSATRQLTRDYSQHGPLRISGAARQWVDALLGETEGHIGSWLNEQRSRPGTIEAACAALRALSDQPNSDLLLSRFDAMLTGFAPASILDVIRAAEAAATAHLAAVAPSRTERQLFRLSCPADGNATLQLRQEVRAALGATDTAMLWSDWMLASDVGAVALTLRLTLRHPAVEFRFGQRPQVTQSGPLDRYHPERFLTHHPVVHRLRAAARSQMSVAQPGITERFYQTIGNAVIPEANQLLFELPMSDRSQLPEIGTAPFMQAVSLAAHVLQSSAEGRQSTICRQRLSSVSA